MTDKLPSSSGACLVWFRNDLRLSDQPTLHAAIASGKPVICIYILESNSELRPLGGASLWWLHHSLQALDESLKALSGALYCFNGNSETLLPQLVASSNITEVHWCRRYGEAEREIDSRIKVSLKAVDVQVQSHNGSLLFEPWQVQNKTQEPYRVFTPFWKAAMAGPPPAQPLPPPTHITSGTAPSGAVAIEGLKLLPTKPDWAAAMGAFWNIGEAGALERLHDFIDGELTGYADNRDKPGVDATSRLSPHLRFGEISPRSIFHAAMMAQDTGDAPPRDVAKFVAELGWREFSYSLLFYNPKLATENFQSRFDAFPWMKPDSVALKAWRHGQTGYPIVDAGMRELWQTGTMHNRVRMIVASFLIKHLMVDWRIGEEWFWDTLCDADSASNAASWQWVAGSGADASPYYRIFNPIIQGEKFDPDGVYVKKYVPELENLNASFIHKPWEATGAQLAAAGIVLGKNYPRPIVDHAAARERAMAAFQLLPKTTA